MKTIKKELQPLHDNAKSFYKKAYLIYYAEDNGSIQKIDLLSYETIVLTIDTKPVLHSADYLTSTTLRHVKEALKQYGFKADTKKQIIKDYLKQD